MRTPPLDPPAPGAARVADVTGRDGLQSRPEVLAPALRRNWVLRLLAAGVPEVEAGSFARPDLLPQLAGTAEVLAGLEPFADRLWVVVPNREGLDQAIRAGARNVLCLLSATESHSRENLGRPIAEVLRGLEIMRRVAGAAGLTARAALSMAWVDPREGRVPAGRALALARALREQGFAELTLCDTLGQACPEEVAELVAGVQESFPGGRLGLHLHDGAGQAAAGILAGLALGVRRFEAALAGLGGCPFAPGAAANLDTERLVELLHSAGLETGIDPAALAAARVHCLEELLTASSGRPDPRS